MASSGEKDHIQQLFRRREPPYIDNSPVIRASQVSSPQARFSETSPNRKLLNVDTGGSVRAMDSNTLSPSSMTPSQSGMEYGNMGNRNIHIASQNRHGGTPPRSTFAQQQVAAPDQAAVPSRSVSTHRHQRGSQYSGTPNPLYGSPRQAQSPQGVGRTELLPSANISSPSGRQPGNGEDSGLDSSNSRLQNDAYKPHRQPSQHHHHHLHLQQNHPQLQLQSQHQQQFHRKSIGDWDFIKTIGAGSMGKVKLAQHNATGEICAVKIVPRAAKLYQRAHANDPPPPNAQVAAQRQKEFEKEIARDKRTIREGALGRLLFHPFICRLYEIVPMTNHYYMLFEYVEGGQMLDYIVSHGSLKEKNARKFARGIALALDYCHKNNIVHRDLKIENIMINSKGDIKIIDFGLSNLYSPKSLLKTYCGSLYFAAPELLSAKPYIGPEVDIWSFGVVLYVLVCGKVPFDDQSVSVLHEKIKRGNVEYPSFLSRECVSLLSRMLVIDPSKRATLYEISQHPWMNKGYETSFQTFLPKRSPLSLPLDPEVIKNIASFDIGTVESVTEELESILSSVEYQMSSENWYKITECGREYASASNASILPDPTGGFHPLVSIYYLVLEMRKRKKAKEATIRAKLEHAEKKKQTDKLQSFEENSVDVQKIVQSSPSPSKPTVSVPDPHEKPVHRSPDSKSEYPKMQQQDMPPLTIPEQAHTSSLVSAHERKNEESPLDENQQDSSIPEQQNQNAKPSSHFETLDPNAGKNSGINSLLRRLSSKRYRNNNPRDSENAADPSSTPPSIPKVSIIPNSQEQIGGTEPVESPEKDPLVRRGVSMKVTAKERSSPSRIDVNKKDSFEDVIKEHSNGPKTEHTAPNRNRSTSANHTSKFPGFVPVEYLPPLPDIDAKTNKVVSSDSKKVQGNGRKLHPTARAKSVGGHIRRDSYGRPLHPSQQHPPLPNSLASQNSDEAVSQSNNIRDEVIFDDVTLDDLEYQEIPQLSENQIIEQFNHAKPNSMPSIEYPRTLFLKGFFSVQTTSTKPLPVIRYNIISVLSKLGVKFQEVKGGFICMHSPSLQVKRSDSVHTRSTAGEIRAESKKLNETDEEKKLYGDAFQANSEKDLEESLPSRVKTPDPEPVDTQFKSPTRQNSMHALTHLSPNPTIKTHKNSNSIGGISSTGHRRKFSIGNSLLATYRKKNSSQIVMPPNTPATAKVNKLMYSDGEDRLSEDFDDVVKHSPDDDSVDSLNVLAGGGSDMLVSSNLEQRAKSLNVNVHAPRGETKRSPLKFEIHIVKVPLVGLYGVQFKKLLGNTWNYKSLAGQILNELNL